MTDDKPTATISRFKLYPIGKGNYRVQWKWSYDYTLSDKFIRPDVLMNHQYGTGIGDLRSLLKRKGYQIVETWKTT